MGGMSDHEPRPWACCKCKGKRKPMKFWLLLWRWRMGNTFFKSVQRCRTSIKGTIPKERNKGQPHQASEHGEGDRRRRQGDYVCLSHFCSLNLGLEQSAPKHNVQREHTRNLCPIPCFPYIPPVMIRTTTMPTGYRVWSRSFRSDDLTFLGHFQFRWTNKIILSCYSANRSLERSTTSVMDKIKKINFSKLLGELVL